MSIPTPAHELPDPADYAGQPVCARCGTDPSGTKWPICVELVKATCPPSIRRAAHMMTCAKYWPGDEDWLCAECDEIVGDGSDG
jgi:hypothetical protein